MRCLTMWRSNMFDHLATYSKDRTLITCLRRRADGRLFWVVNVHLQAGGGNEDRRLRQVHDALETIRKKAKGDLKLEEEQNTCIVCGDFNVDLKTDAQSSITKLLVDGVVPASTFDNGVLVARKDKKQSLGTFSNAMMLAYESNGREVPSTLVAPQLIPRLIGSNDGCNDKIVPTASFVSAVRSMFYFYATGEEGMTQKEVNEFLEDINLSIERGSEMRFAKNILEEKRLKDGRLESEEKQIYFSSADLISLYMNELKGGKFWGVAHDLVTVFTKFGKLDELETLNLVPMWYLRGVPCRESELGNEREIFEASFDNVFFTADTLELKAFEDISGKCQPMPNEQEPSDHKPVRCVFRFKS